MKSSQIRRLRSFFWILFFPLSFLWWLGALNRARQKFKIPRGKKKPGVFVVAVGSIFSGGSGKTPVVKSLLQGYRDQGTSVISRGYGRRGSETLEVDLSDPRGCAYFGDEPWMLASQTSARILVGSREEALTQIANGLVFLDDGLQQKEIEPDFRLGVLSEDQGWENGFCQPLGDLRAPFSTVKDWDAALVLGSRQSGGGWAEWLGSYFPHVPAFRASQSVVGLWDGSAISAANWEGPAGVFCGIARPEIFLKTVARLGEIAFFQEFSDHYAYSGQDARRLAAMCRDRGVTTLLTTDKDWYKVAPLFTGEKVRLMSVRLELKIPRELCERIEDKIGLS